MKTIYSLLLTLSLLLSPLSVLAQDTPGTVKFPTSTDTADSLIRASNSARSTLSGALSSGATTITVVSAASFPSSGAAMIDNEIVFYTAKTSTQLTGVTRGADSTTAASHLSGAAVRGVITAAHHNTLAAAIVNTQGKLGTGVSVPLAGTFFKGTGAGSSGWGALLSADVTTALGFTPRNAAAATVNTFNTRSGAVTLSPDDVTGALTFTPMNPANSLSEIAGAASAARGNLGLGTMATQNAANVAITGGTLNNVTCVGCTNLGTPTSAGTASTGDVTIASGTDGTGDTIFQAGGVERLRINADGSFVGGQGLVRRFDVRNYGATGDGTTDDTSAFSSAVSACNAAGGCVFYVPKGRYKTSGGFIFTVPVVIRGDGSANGRTADSSNFAYISRVDCTSATATLFTITSMYARFEYIALVNKAATTPTAGAGILVTTPNLPSPDTNYHFNRVDYDSIYVGGFYDNVDVLSGTNWVMDKSDLHDPVRYGIRIRNLNNIDGGDWRLVNSIISSGVHQPDSAVRVEGSGGGALIGMKINSAGGSNAFPSFAKGLDAYMSPGTSIMYVGGGSSFENIRTNGISIIGNGGDYGLVTIDGVEVGMYGSSDDTDYPVYLDRVVTSSIDNIVINSDTTRNIAVLLHDCKRVKVGSVVADNYNYRVFHDGTYSDAPTSGRDDFNPMTFSGTWHDEGTNGYPGGYMKENGRVWLRGLVTGGTVNTAICTLPIGYRPRKLVSFQVFNNGSSCSIQIDTSGVVTQAGGASGTNVSLEGVSFPT